MIKILRFWALLSFFLFQGLKGYCTHLKAGEITAEKIPGPSGLEYKYTLTIYTDSISPVDEPDATLVFSDGEQLTSPRNAKTYIGHATYKSTYTFYKTFPGLGSYNAYYLRDNRNNNIRNINNGNSQDFPFYIETQIRIRAGDNNNTPLLLNPPVDIGNVGQKYTHNPAAFDVDGDSLSYEFTIPKMSASANVTAYGQPNVAPVPAGSFTINPLTGDIAWDAPQEPGYYSFAYLVREWRNGVLIGTIRRDMQIEILENQNKPPRRLTPKDTCVKAGDKILEQVTAIDLNIPPNPIRMSAIGGVFSLSSSPATFFAANPQPSPAFGIFSWQTTCSHIREQPYNVIFKLEDIPNVGLPLTEETSWQITVLAPEPKNLKVVAVGNGHQLSWDAYSCSNAQKMEIYRRVCDSSHIVTNACEPNNLVSLGFTKIVEVPITTLNYFDTINISPGSFYSYTIAAVFPSPAKGRSFASNQASVGAFIGEPLPTTASVLETNTTNGKILVKWTRPIDLDLSAFPGPYKYEVQRASSISGGTYITIAVLNSIFDTSFVDSMLNTEENIYNYKINFYYNGNQLKSTSESFSSVFLTSEPGHAQVTLTWKYDVPWENSDQYHRIYKETSPGIFTLIDSVLVVGNTGAYVATELFNNNEVCFYVETSGRYCKDNLPSPLLNNSNIACEIPRDKQPPCPPILSGPTQCIEEGIIQLTINWIPNLSPGCNTDIKGYNVYYTEHEEDEMILLASNVPDTFFVDTDNFSLAGCYAVTALNFFGIESPKSNNICVDICVYYELPNLITPNNDSLNDLFVPLPIPKNVEVVKFTVYNRWGKRVYFSDDDIHLNWPGVASDGSVLSAGIYYFVAEVNYKRRLKRSDQIQVIKGWIHIVRKEDEPSSE